MNKLTNSFLWPTFIIGDRIAKHLVEDGLGKGIEVAELGVFLVDDASEKVQFIDDALLLFDRRDYHINVPDQMAIQILYHPSCSQFLKLPIHPFAPEIIIKKTLIKNVLLITNNKPSIMNATIYTKYIWFTKTH